MINLLPIAGGFLMVSIAVWHEWTWYRRQRHCVKLAGRIVDEIKDKVELDTRWEIQYEHNGVAHRFISRYGGSSTMKVGDEAVVILDLDEGIAEHLTWSNRWVFTLGPIFLGVVSILAGSSMICQDSQAG